MWSTGENVGAGTSVTEYYIHDSTHGSVRMPFGCDCLGTAAFAVAVGVQDWPWLLAGGGRSCKGTWQR